MTKLSQQALFWSPRLFAIAYIVFLSLFALDAFTEHQALATTILSFAIHLVPALILTVVVILAWRWEWIGALLFAAAGLAYIITVLPLRLSAATKLSWILTISLPAFLLAAMLRLSRCRDRPGEGNQGLAAQQEDSAD